MFEMSGSRGGGPSSPLPVPSSGGGPSLSNGGKSCDASDIPNLPASLSVWERALGVWNPHPILPGGHEEMHCFGP